MDSHYLGYTLTAADLPYSSIPTRLLNSLKFDSTNSPNSPFSTHFDTDTLVDTQEQHSPSDYLSEATPSSGSSGDYNINLRQSTSPFLTNANNNHNIKHALLELESALMAPDIDEEATTSYQYLGVTRQSPSHSNQGSHSNQPDSSPDYQVSSSFGRAQIENRGKGMEDFAEQSGGGGAPNDLKSLLIACARALSENRLDEFENLVQIARSAVSISGEPLQRLGAYLIEGLIARKESSGTNIYRALKCNEPESKDLLSYMHILYEICPYVKFGYMAANGAIAEACKNEDRIHIIDFQIAHGTQWMTLLQALASRPSGPPHVRITGIDDPVNQYARGDGLTAVERRLSAISQKFNIPVEFHAVPVFAPDITLQMLDVRHGEALVVNFPLQLHHTPDESVDVSKIIL